MRIIAGEFRGRKILPPEGADVTRPVTDRVKQSVFDILAPHIPGATIYDLFAGTGSMGLECLSRGAARVVFFEADRSAVARLRRNLQALGIPAGRYGIQTPDVFKTFAARDALATDEPAAADVIFLDPPYRYLRDRPDDLRRLGGQLLKYLNDGIVVFRHDADDALELPGLRVADERTYGGMTVEFLRPVESAPPPP